MAFYLEIFLVSGIIWSIQIKLQSTNTQSLANWFLHLNTVCSSPRVIHGFPSPKDRAEPNPEFNTDF